MVQPQSFRVREVLLLIVPLPGFGVMSVLAVGAGRAVVPRGARVRTGSDRAGVVLLSCSWGILCWSGGCWQGAQPLPAGEERVFPGPVGADLEDALAGVMGQAGGDVPDPVAERVRVGFPQVRVVAEAEEAGPGGQVGGDVRRDDPAAVDLPGFGWKVPQAHGLGRADAAGLHGSHHPQYIDTVHREHAAVETAGVRTAKAMGLRNLPSKSWQVNTGWVIAANIAADLTAWTRLLGLCDDPDLREADPDTLRYRIWHIPARLARHARQRILKISPDWPWKEAFLTCWQRPCAPPAPA